MSLTDMIFAAVGFIVWLLPGIFLATGLWFSLNGNVIPCLLCIIICNQELQRRKT